VRKHEGRVLLILAAVLTGCRPAAKARELNNLVYAKVDSTDLKLDLFLPLSTASASPVVVMVHGGG
jgi:poly(3-hydroxybutyrate) depolymerase